MFLSGICPLIIFWPQVTLSYVTQIWLRVFPALRGSSIKFLSRGRPNYELSVVAIPCNLSSQSLSLSLSFCYASLSDLMLSLSNIASYFTRLNLFFFFLGRYNCRLTRLSFCAKNYAHIIHIFDFGQISH